MSKTVRICNYDHPLIQATKQADGAMKIWSFLEQNEVVTYKIWGIYSTKHAGLLLGVDAIYLSKALDTVRLILVPCWAHYFLNVFSLSLDQAHLSQKTLGVKVLRHPVLIFLGTTVSCTATVWDRGLDPPSRG